jgi:Holliday junction resolvase RusA-like endonuclease
MRELKLILLGEPVPKQSVRQGKNRNGQSTFYQPQKFEVLTMQYCVQLTKQVPRDFKMFEKWVRVDRCIFVHAPTKAMLKNKAQSEFLKLGTLFRKTTRPDMLDNLCKFPFDVLTGYVYTDDSLICESGFMGKYYGLNPRIEIDLIGE